MLVAVLGAPTGVAGAAAASAPAPAGAGMQLEDRVIAVVDDDPILASDLERTLALGLVTAKEGESPEALRQRALDGLIEQRLRFHEVDRYGLQQVPVEEVEAQVQAIRNRFPSTEAFEARLKQLKMDQPALRQLVARQLQVMTYVDELLGARVFVGLEEIQRYYDEQLLPQLQKAGQPVPALEEVREQIREVIRQQRLNQELERWTAELRRKADIVVQLERPERPLPPPVAEKA